MSKTTHSKRYATLKKRYERNGCTKEQLHEFVELNALTQEEYKEITGEDYAE
ncbi:MAG: XkdX family protein [Lachnospiraceae bacterium]|nr:XkdX family protein [Lachnospiraceae bacterium]